VLMSFECKINYLI